jgi:hypothetical protein
LFSFSDIKTTLNAVKPEIQSTKSDLSAGREKDHTIQLKWVTLGAPYLELKYREGELAPSRFFQSPL